MDKYVGCKVEHNRNECCMKLIQPVLLQSFEDEFDLEDGGHTPKIPAKMGQVLSKGELEISNKERYESNKTNNEDTVIQNTQRIKQGDV
eukprot:10859033-Ditylum_brightwellii.AAC.2